ncbi:Keratin, type I cytoskeletal 18 [Plecturocebus cupreus]
MSFTTHSTFYTNCWSLGSVEAPMYAAWLSAAWPASMQARGLWFPDLRVLLHQLPVQQLPVQRPDHGMAGGLAGMGGIQNEKETTQSLNDCLASYLRRNLWTETGT